MKFLKSLVLMSSLLASSVYGAGFGFNVGPFNMQFNAFEGEYVANNRSALDSPICNAISNHKQLEITVEGVETVSTKEKKIVVKTLIVEPYAFGITKDGKPVLRGNVVDEKLVKEVTLKYGEDKFDESSVSSKQKDKGFFSGMFSNDKNKNIDIRKIRDIQVIDDSHFDAPKDYKGVNDDNIQVVCQLPVANPKQK